MLEYYKMIYFIKVSEENPLNYIKKNIDQVMKFDFQGNLIDCKIISVKDPMVEVEIIDKNFIKLLKNLINYEIIEASIN